MSHPDHPSPPEPASTAADPNLDVGLDLDPPAASRRNVASLRYLIPNGITCASLLLGLAASLQAVQGDLLDAAWLIMLCVLLDKADGSAARLLKATSELGSQLDSFADLIAFGVAPAALIYGHFSTLPRGDAALWAGPAARTIFYALLAIFVVGATVRLARFNVAATQAHRPGVDGVFFGLPTTFAGGAIAVVYLVAMAHDLEAVIRWLPVLMGVLGFAMVARFVLPKLMIRESLPLNIFLGINMVLTYVTGLGRIWPEYLLFALTSYAIVGFIWGTLHRREYRDGGPGGPGPASPRLS